MRLLFVYIFKPLFDLAVALVKGIAMWIIRQIISCIRFAWPYVLRLVLQSLWYALQLVGIALLSLLKGLGLVETMAQHWTAEALAHGFPDIWTRHLLWTMRFLAILTIGSGWAIILFTGWFSGDYVLQLIFPVP